LHHTSPHFAIAPLYLPFIHPYKTLASSRLRGEDSTPSVVELHHSRRAFASRGNFTFHLLLTPYALGAGECYSKMLNAISNLQHFGSHH
jgi:hypothetical protein